MAEGGEDGDKRRNLKDDSFGEREKENTQSEKNGKATHTHHHHYYQDCQNVTHETKIEHSKISSLNIVQAPGAEETLDQQARNARRELEAMKLGGTLSDIVILYREETSEGEEDDPYLAQTWNSMIEESLEQHTLETEINKKGRADELFRKGQQYNSTGKFIHSLVSFFAAAKLHKTNEKEVESIGGIAACSQGVRDVANKMAEQPKLRKLIPKHVVSVLYKMKQFITSVDSPRRNDKIASEALCLFYIGLCYNYCKDFKKYADINEEAISFMQKELGAEAEKYKIYGKCFINAGRAYSEMEEKSTADEKYTLALGALEKVKDWKSNEEKNKLLKKAKANKEANRYKMKK